MTVKLLSYKRDQRYIVRRTMLAAEMEARERYPGLIVEVEEISALSEIERYTPVVILPSLVVDDELVCVGRFPKRDEITAWLKMAIERQR